MASPELRSPGMEKPVSFLPSNGWEASYTPPMRSRIEVAALSPHAVTIDGAAPAGVTEAKTGPVSRYTAGLNLTGIDDTFMQMVTNSDGTAKPASALNAMYQDIQGNTGDPLAAVLEGYGYSVPGVFGRLRGRDLAKEVPLILENLGKISAAITAEATNRAPRAVLADNGGDNGRDVLIGGAGSDIIPTGNSGWFDWVPSWSSMTSWLPDTPSWVPSWKGMTSWVPSWSDIQAWPASLWNAIASWAASVWSAVPAWSNVKTWPASVWSSIASAGEDAASWVASMWSRLIGK